MHSWPSTHTHTCIYIHIYICHTITIIQLNDSGLPECSLFTAKLFFLQVVVLSSNHIWIWISRCGGGGGKAVGVSAEVEETIIIINVYSFFSEDRPIGSRATPQKLSFYFCTLPIFCFELVAAYWK